MTSTVVNGFRSTPLRMAGSDTLTVNAPNGNFSNGTGTETVLFDGPTNGAVITTASNIRHIAVGGSAIVFGAAIGTTLNATINLIGPDGLIMAFADGIRVEPGSLTGGLLSIVNAGYIRVEDLGGTSGQAIDTAGVSAGLVLSLENQAGSRIRAFTNDAIRLGNTAHIVNAGEINGGASSDVYSGAAALTWLAGSAGTLQSTATGDIIGDGDGIRVETTTLSVTNAGFITARNGAGIRANGNLTLTNSGEIAGRYGNFLGSDLNAPGAPGVSDGSNDGDGDGLVVLGTASIVNSGRIRGVSSGGHGSDGLANSSQGIRLGGGSVSNLAGGSISGTSGVAILGGGGPVHVDNAGGISGDISLPGSSPDLVENLGSTATAIIDGDIFLGGGDDRLVVGGVSQILGIASGGLGVDILDVSQWNGGGMAINLALGTGGSAGTLEGFENVIGSAFSDTLIGDGQANVIEGGAGNDSLTGGDANDTASYAGSTSSLLVALLLQGSGQDTRGAGIDTLNGFENITGGSGDDTLGGDEGANTLSGGAGDDQLISVGGDDLLQGGAGRDLFYGGIGNDSLEGGADDDIYVIEDAGDQVFEAAGAGFDTAFVTTDGWVQGLHVELSYIYANATSMTGSAGDDVLVANPNLAGAFNGAAGADTLWGQGMADTIRGGTGDDVIRAQGGDDRLLGEAGQDKLVGGAGADFFAFDAPGWGLDEIFDFNVADGDRIDLRGSGFAAFTFVQEIGGSTQAGAPDGSIINIYGVTSIPSFAFIF